VERDALRYHGRPSTATAGTAEAGGFCTWFFADRADRD
jgi:hypothetical protein